MGQRFNALEAEHIRFIEAQHHFFVGTTAHVAVVPRMTLLFCAFEAKPLILRVYGTARTIAHGAPGWDERARHFAVLPGARQIFDLTVDLVQTSCGMAVPRFAFRGDRGELAAWARRKGPAGLRRCWERKNRRGLDGLPAPIPEANG